MLLNTLEGLVELTALEPHIYLLDIVQVFSNFLVELQCLGKLEEALERLESLIIQAVGVDFLPVREFFARIQI